MLKSEIEIVLLNSKSFMKIFICPSLSSLSVIFPLSVIIKSGSWASAPLNSTSVSDQVVSLILSGLRTANLKLPLVIVENFDCPLLVKLNLIKKPEPETE